MKLIHVDQEILFYAFRYALGRKTYVVGDVVNNLINNWVLLEPLTRKQLVNEVSQAIENNEAGMKQDVQEWQKILDLDTK